MLSGYQMPQVQAEIMNTQSSITLLFQVLKVPFSRLSLNFILYLHIRDHDEQLLSSQKIKREPGWFALTLRWKQGRMKYLFRLFEMERDLSCMQKTLECHRNLAVGSTTPLSGLKLNAFGLEDFQPICMAWKITKKGVSLDLAESKCKTSNCNYCKRNSYGHISKTVQKPNLFTTSTN